MFAFDTGGLRVAGTITFNADGSYREDLSFGGRLVTTFPTTCLSGSDLTFNCEQVGQVFQKESGTNPWVRYTSASCSEMGGLCSCVFTAYKQTQQPRQGTYSTSGTDLTVSWGSSLFQTRPYCAMASALSLQRRTKELVDETTLLEPNLTLMLTRE